MTAILCALAITAFNPEGAKAKLESTKDRMRAIASEKASIDTKQKEMRKLSDELIDFDDVVKQTLGESYATMSSAQRKEFTTTLRQLVEASYISKINDANTADIAFSDATAVGEFVSVKATAHAQGSEVHLEFKLALHRSGWLVHDVVIDDVSLVRNYRGQFKKQLAKGSVAELQKKIQKKVAELKAQKTEATQKSG